MPFLHKKGLVICDLYCYVALDFYGGEKFVSKNVSKKPRGKNGRSQINSV